MVFSAQKARAYVSFKTPVARHYELEIEITINRAKETTRIWLPIASGGAMHLDIRGDSGNTESPTATISLSGSKQAPERMKDEGLYKVRIGKPVKLRITVRQTGKATGIDVVRDRDGRIFAHHDEHGEFKPMTRTTKGQIALETAYYTNSTFHKLVLHNRGK